MTWCVFGVLQGVEHEELFDADLNLIGRSDNQRATSAASPRPATSTASTTRATKTAISIHIYGTDVTRIGSSVRRYYD